MKRPSRSLAPLVKLPILHICISQHDTEMEITVRYGYAASTGSLVWALTKRESDREKCFQIYRLSIPSAILSEFFM